jgi:predicted porin
MKRSATLLAVGGLTLSASAFAQEQGELSIYGSLQPYVENFRTSGATPEGLSPETGGATQVTVDDYSGDNIPNRFRLISGTSHIGFRGELKLSEHFSAFFQVENAAPVDGDPFILAASWASRNSAVGLKGTFGTLFLGTWDTPYKYPLLFVGPLRGLNSFNNVITATPGFNIPGTTTRNGRSSSAQDAAFNRRQGNSVQYWTPKVYGFSARFALSLNEGKTRREFDPSINPTIWSGLFSFEHGPLAVHYAYEQHRDYFGMDWVGGSPGGTFLNPKSVDDGHEIVAWYTLPTDTTLAVVLERLTYRSDDEVVGAVNGYQREAVYSSLKQRLGNHAVWGSYGVANSGRCTTVGNLPCSTNGLSATQWSVGYTYSPAKTVDLYGAYYEMINERSASYGLFPPVAPVAPGTTTHAFGVGIQYIFEFTTTVGADEPPAEAPNADPPEPAAEERSEEPPAPERAAAEAPNEPAEAPEAPPEAQEEPEPAEEPPAAEPAQP